MVNRIEKELLKTDKKDMMFNDYLRNFDEKEILMEFKQIPTLDPSMAASLLKSKALWWF